jgi:hypothetical protein
LVNHAWRREGRQSQLGRREDRPSPAAVFYLIVSPCVVIGVLAPRIEHKGVRDPTLCHDYPLWVLWGGGELDDTGKRCQRQPMRGEGPTTTDNRRWRLPPVSTSPEMREEDGELRWGSPKPRRRYLYSAPWMGRGMARLAGSHRGKEE